ncbi:MAG: glycosyltransferase family 4 protein [Elusimicrobiales bacterium]
MKRRTKILFVIENACYGGGEKTFSLLIRALPKEDFGVYCAALPSGRFYDEVKDHCRFLPLDLSCRLNLRNIGRLKKMMAENGIDVAHSQGARADFFSALAAAKAGVRAVSTVAMPVDGFEVGFVRKKIYLALNAVAEKRTHSFITVANYIKELLVQRHGIAGGRVDVIPNPAVLDGGQGFDASRVINELGLRGRIVLAALGRLENQKGFDILLEALPLLGKTRPDLFEKIKCVIAGSGSLEADLRRRAAPLGDKVVFTGFRSDVRDFLAAADVFVLPSRSEGQPLALLEAMAIGKPVLAADLPGVKEIVTDWANGALFKSGDPAALAERLAALLSDPAGACRMGAKATEMASRFTLQSFVEGHETFYRKVFPEAQR